MRKFVKYVAIALISGALCVPAADARGRNNNQPDRRTEKTTARKRPATPAAGNKSGRNDKHAGKPADKHAGKPQAAPAPNARRPHTGPAKPQTPQKPQAPRPPHGQPAHNRPHQAPPPHIHHVNHGRPPRPFMPAPRPYRRPTPPPPAWRPAAWRPIQSILGVAFGTALGMSINYLVNGGYDVSGYDNDMVYLNNVSMLNYSWPVANLYYASGGGLAGSEFVYYTTRRKMKRFNAVYRDLVRVYGQPYSVRNIAGGGRLATWWGTDGQYITLNCGTDIAGNGSSHFYTTLSFGR